MTPASARRVENACEDTPTSPDVIVANTLNFQPNFKISRLKFCGETRPTKGVGYQGLGNL